MSDFDFIPPSGVIIAAVIAFSAIVIVLWEGVKWLVPHIHIYWR